MNKAVLSGNEAIARGASFGDGRALACMKHVGVNFAADPVWLQALEKMVPSKVLEVNSTAFAMRHAL